jgi:hypothetical protein
MVRIKDLPQRRPTRRVDIPNPPIVPSLNNQQNQNDVCQIKEVEQGVVVPYRLPPGTAVTGPDAVLSELRSIARLLEEHRTLFEEIRGYLSYKVPLESANLLETQQVTRVATPGARNSISQDTVTDGTIAGYDEIEVWNSLGGRKAPRVWLVNDGVQGTGIGDNLFLRISPDGISFSPEFTMILGEIRIATDVYTIRFRSPTANITLRASEREIYPPYVTQIANTFTTAGAVNRPNFTARNVAVPALAVDGTLPSITIPDGYALSIRANIANTANVFVSRTNATVAASSITLGAGDSVTLFITDAILVHVSSSVALPVQTVDLLVEQN